MNTKTKIIEIARNLIQESGANSFSYQDIADQLHIKKASIHYYFPHKNDLLLELVRFYSKELEFYLANIDQNYKSSKDKFKKYLAIYTEISKTQRKLCLCGILAGEIFTLPPELNVEINKFFEIHEDWLMKLYISCEATKQSARAKARSLLSTLQGAMLISRSLGDPQYLKQVIRRLYDSSY